MTHGWELGQTRVDNEGQVLFGAVPENFRGCVFITPGWKGDGDIADLAGGRV